jgi:hypothetical protein
LLALALAGGSVWLALLVGAALALADAALGAGMMVNPAVPARIRRLINVESGLNDGIATPFVSVALAGAATGGQVADQFTHRRVRNPRRAEGRIRVRRMANGGKATRKSLEEGEHHG